MPAGGAVKRALRSAEGGLRGGRVSGEQGIARVVEMLAQPASPAVVNGTPALASAQGFGGGFNLRHKKMRVRDMIGVWPKSARVR